MRRRLVILSCVAALATSCGGAEPATETTQTGADMQQSSSGVDVTGGTDSKPEITIPEEDPPAELEVTDLVEGDGAEAQPGSTVTAHYVGVCWSTQEQFDASWDRGQPIAFPLDEVIPGWTQGIPGMREGGRRLLVIPPDLAYGDNPPPGAGIQPGETLVFVVDLVSTE